MELWGYGAMKLWSYGENGYCNTLALNAGLIQGY